MLLVLAVQLISFTTAASVDEQTQNVARQRIPNQKVLPVQIPNQLQLISNKIYATLDGNGAIDKIALGTLLAKHCTGNIASIIEIYNNQHTPDLATKIVGKTSGNIISANLFQYIAVSLTKTIFVYDAEIIHSAIRGIETDITLLIEILGISLAYKILYKEEYAVRIASKLHGHNEHLLLKLIRRQ